MVAYFVETEFSVLFASSHMQTGSTSNLKPWRVEAIIMQMMPVAVSQII
jgi:hypothetical protein